MIIFPVTINSTPEDGEPVILPPCYYIRVIRMTENDAFGCTLLFETAEQGIPGYQFDLTAGGARLAVPHKLIGVDDAHQWFDHGRPAQHPPRVRVSRHRWYAGNPPSRAVLALIERPDGKDDFWDTPDSFANLGERWVSTEAHTCPNRGPTVGNKGVSGLTMIPCTGMRSAVLEAYLPNGTGAFNLGACVSVRELHQPADNAAAAGSVGHHVLPLGIVLPGQNLAAGDTNERVKHFRFGMELTGLGHWLRVQAWKLDDAAAPVFAQGAISVRLSRQPLNNLEMQNGAAGATAYNIGAAVPIGILSIINRRRGRYAIATAENMDAADTFNVSLYGYFNAGTLGGADVHVRGPASAGGVVAGAVASVNMAAINWHAATLSGVAAANVVDELRAGMMESLA